MSTTIAPPITSVVLASDNNTHKKSKFQGSSSVDARRQVRERDPASSNRTDTSEPNRIDMKKVSHANISIDLTLTNNNANEQHSSSQHRSSNPQYKTESLERILGSQAESYFRQIERTMQMGPVNVASSHNKSQRGASHSQSSRLSGKTAGKDMQISLTMPGIAEFGTSSGSSKRL